MSLFGHSDWIDGEPSKSLHEVAQMTPKPDDFAALVDALLLAKRALTIHVNDICEQDPCPYDVAVEVAEKALLAAHAQVVAERDAAKATLEMESNNSYNTIERLKAERDQLQAQVERLERERHIKSDSAY